jgi:hypothetical protein
MLAYIFHVSLRPHAEPISAFECQQQIMTMYTQGVPPLADCYRANQSVIPIVTPETARMLRILSRRVVHHSCSARQ